MAYTERPAQRRARIAWDYFMDKKPWMKTTKRTLELSYSPNIDFQNKGWVMHVGSLPDDLLHWHGGDDIIFTVLVGSLDNWG